MYADYTNLTYSNGNIHSIQSSLHIHLLSTPSPLVLKWAIINLQRLWFRYKQETSDLESQLTILKMQAQESSI